MPRHVREPRERFRKIGILKASAMVPDAIYSKLTEILRDVFDDDALVADPELTADQVAGWDSFAHLRLIMSVESAFAVRFSALQISNLQNVGDLARLIASRLSV